MKFLRKLGKDVAISLPVKEEEDVLLIQERVGVRKLRFQLLLQVQLSGIGVMVSIKINEGEGQRVEIRQVSAGRL